MPRDPFVELEAARANALEEAEQFVRELEPVLGPSLHAGFERLRRASQISGRPLRVVAEALIATFD